MTVVQVTGALNLSAQSLSGASPLDSLFATAADGTLLESGLDLGGGNTVSAIKVSGEVDKDLLNGKNGPGNLFEGQIAGEAVLAVAGSLGALQVQALAGAEAQLRALRLNPALALGDVADVFYGPADATAYVRLNGEAVISLGVVRQAQSNSVAISEGVRAVDRALDAPYRLGFTGGTSPISARYAGVIDRLTVSPTASWNPSCAPVWKMNGWSWYQR